MSRPPSAATSTVRSANEPRHAYAHLYEIVRQRAAVTPSAVAVGGQQGLGWKTLSSQQLLDLVDRLAVELAGEGVQPGDRVVLWVPNHWRTPVFLFALWKLGAVIIPFDREMNPNAAADILALVEARCVIVGYDERPAWVHRGGVVQWWEPGTRGGSAAADWTTPDERQAAIFFTSGTTGNPKGCVITHANLLSQVEAGFERIPLDGGCRLASILPLSHLFELTCGLLYPPAAGAAVHYIPSRGAPDILRVLSEQRITHMMAVPQLLTMMGQALEQQLQRTLPRPVYAGLRATARRLSFAGRRRLYWKVHKKLGGHLRLLAAGGAPLSNATHQLWEGLGVRVTQGNGASECSPIIACGATDGSTPAGSVGRSIRGVEVQTHSRRRVASPRSKCHGRLLARPGPHSRGNSQRLVPHRRPGHD